MQMSMYQASVPVILRGFAATSAIIDKAVAHAAAKKIDPSVLVNFRLAPDMLPLKAQIGIMSDVSKGGVGRLAGVEIPSFADTETTFEELRARIDKTVSFLNGIKPAQVDGTEDKQITLQLGPANAKVEMKFTGIHYLLDFVMPNFYFHATTVYAILRHCGVELGKRDFLGPPR